MDFEHPCWNLLTIDWVMTISIFYPWKSVCRTQKKIHDNTVNNRKSQNKRNKDGLRPGRGSEVDKTGFTLCQRLKIYKVSYKVFTQMWQGHIRQNYCSWKAVWHKQVNICKKMHFHIEMHLWKFHQNLLRNRRVMANLLFLKICVAYRAENLS